MAEHISVDLEGMDDVPSFALAAKPPLLLTTPARYFTHREKNPRASKISKRLVKKEVRDSLFNQEMSSMKDRDAARKFKGNERADVDKDKPFRIHWTWPNRIDFTALI